jgi:hypothetical protein
MELPVDWYTAILFSWRGAKSQENPGRCQLTDRRAPALQLRGRSVLLLTSGVEVSADIVLGPEDTAKRAAQIAEMNCGLLLEMTAAYTTCDQTLQLCIGYRQN